MPHLLTAFLIGYESFLFICLYFRFMLVAGFSPMNANKLIWSIVVKVFYHCLLYIFIFNNGLYSPLLELNIKVVKYIDDTQ